MTNPDTSGTVETKVKVAATVALLVGVGVALLNAVQASPGLIAFLPPTAQALVLAVIPPVLVFAAAWAAPHTPR